jgi:hypothetical protein
VRLFLRFFHPAECVLQQTGAGKKQSKLVAHSSLKSIFTPRSEQPALTALTTVLGTPSIAYGILKNGHL